MGNSYFFCSHSAGLKFHANCLLNGFLYFTKQNLAVDANCLFRRQFTWNAIFHSGWENKKIHHKFVVC